jgi:DNA-binding NtrC family response regulator
MEIAETNRTAAAVAGAPGERVLVLASSGVDREVLCQTLSAAGISALECETLHELRERAREGAACAILADEVLDAEGIAAVVTMLEGQPEWSDLPLIVMARQGQEQGRGWRLLRKMNGAAHTVVLERPVHTVTLVSAVRAALRSRARQYQIRDELARLRRTEEELRRSERRLRELNETASQRADPGGATRA